MDELEDSFNNGLKIRYKMCLKIDVFNLYDALTLFVIIIIHQSSYSEFFLNFFNIIFFFGNEALKKLFKLGIIHFDALLNTTNSWGNPVATEYFEFDHKKLEIGLYFLEHES